jgi:alpha-tubulin suppressor-like RCC1 family protein
MDNGIVNPDDPGSHNISPSQEEGLREINVPHQLDPDPFEAEDGSFLTQVYASYYYSAAVNSKGEVYTWGSGEFGRLGYIDTKK